MSDETTETSIEATPPKKSWPRSLPIHSIDDVQRELTKVYRQTWLGKKQPDVSRACIRALSVKAALMKEQDLASAVLQLQELMVNMQMQIQDMKKKQAETVPT